MILINLNVKQRADGVWEARSGTSAIVAHGPDPHTAAENFIICFAVVTERAVGGAIDGEAFGPSPAYDKAVLN